MTRIPAPFLAAARSTDRDGLQPSRRHLVVILTCALLLPAVIAGCGDDEGEGPGTGAADTRIPAPDFPPVSDTVLSRGAGEAWPTTGGNLANLRFSPLEQINRTNIGDLVPVWIHSTGIEGALEGTPVVVGNTMYVTTAGGRVLALNAATGEELWAFDPALAPVALCCGPVNKGVSAYGPMVYVASLDARLIALDARNGRPVWERELADPEAGYSATMAPLAVDGRVYVGVAGERYGIRGFLAAFDARSGQELWRWHTIPSDEAGGWWGDWTPTDPFGTPLNRDLEAERRDSADAPGSWNVGGGGIATTPAYDPSSRRLYVNVEGPAPLASGAVRSGDNLYTGSIVALDARTGERIWHAQYLPHDVWGLSGGSPPFLFERGDGMYVGFAGRTGWVYVFDARNGQPVLRSDNFVPQENLFERPTSEQPVLAAPGVNGGNPGAPVAYDPRTGTVFVGGVHQPTVYVPDPGPYRRGQLWLGGNVRFSPDADHWGTVSAIDLGNGEIRWQRQTPAPVHSGVLATAGDLVFVGQGDGAIDAFDARNGDLLWQFRTGAGVHGGAVTYMVGDVQYVAVPAGGSFHLNTPDGDDILAFALASRRPARAVANYRTTSYERGGAARPGGGGVRQLETETAQPPAPTPGAIPGDTAMPPDTATPADPTASPAGAAGADTASVR